MSHKELWIQVLRRLQPTIKKAYFLTWFQSTMVLDVKDSGEMVVGVPSLYAQGWIRDKYDVKILQAAQEFDPKVKSVAYEVASEEEKAQGLDVKLVFSEEFEKKVRKVRNLNEVNISRGSGVVSSQMLNDRYNLNNFVVGQENRLPHAAAMAVAKMPGGIYNPLYVYGKVGLGKTHLVQAIGMEIIRNFPDKVVKYLTAERFVSEVVEAIGRRHMSSFKDRYRNVDCFLVDDIQFFARKDSSQQEFFHTFNELYNHNKQVVLTSDRAPSELDDLDVRLKDRFGMGMVVELLMPEFETRVAILQRKCQEYQTIIDPDILSFIANNITTSVRELEGVLKQLIAESQLAKESPSIRSAAEIIRRMNKAQEIIGYDIEAKRIQRVANNALDIVRAVADYYRLSVEDLQGDDRHKNVMWARQVGMYLIRKELGESYEKIGHGFGGRNHTTVMHACNKMEEMLRRDFRLLKDVNAIRRGIQV